MKIFVARDMGISYHFEVHLDESKVLADGSPDPAFVRSYDWPKSQDKAVSLREMALLCEDELARMNPQPMAEQGMTLEATLAPKPKRAKKT